MAPALDQQPLGGQQMHGGAKVNPRDRAARALAFAIFKANHHGGAVGGLFEAGRDDADHAGMPAFASGPDKGAIDAARFGLGKGLFAHARLDVAALGVELVQPGGKGGGFARVIGGK
jgi:hypothetical protein